MDQGLARFPERGQRQKKAFDAESGGLWAWGRAFSVLATNRRSVAAMAAGSVTGSGIGGLQLSIVPGLVLVPLRGVPRVLRAQGLAAPVGA